MVKNKILVIDDDLMNLHMAKHILKDSYDVVCASSGTEGLRLLKEMMVDLVLLDFGMPIMDGLEVLNEIRKDETFAAVKIIMMSSPGNDDDTTEALRLGALDFIKKPFFPTELLERIKKALWIERKDRVLVVDDDPMNLAFAKKILGIRYEVFCIDSGSEALKYLEANAADLVLLDLHMPEMDGFEVMERMQQMDTVRDIPVIFLTADGGRQTEADIFKAGAMDYIQKPLCTEIAIRRVNRSLELYHYQHSLQMKVDKKTEALRESNRRIINMSAQVMMALVSAIDAKDAYTNGHSVRVAEYTRELSIRMGKTPQEATDMYYVGLMHDVGKIGIPDRIINKPGMLTDEEYEMVKQHPSIGAQILDNITEMPDISVGAHWHHERYEGGGYPDGLSGEEIPEIARIVCVADAYDTMTSNRSYRGVLPQDVVRSEIVRGMGSQFDPKIAAYMLGMIDEDKDYIMHE